MMKIRNCLLVSISYFSLCSLAQANISEGEKEFIFTHTSKGVEQTSAASFGVIKYRGLNTAAVLEHTHLLHLDSHSQLLSSSNLPQTQSEHRASFAPISLALTDGPTASVASLEIREQDTGNRALTAAVCFVTDTGNCSGNKYGGANTSDNSSSGGTPSGSSSSSGGTPSGSSSGSSSSGGDEDWTIDNRKRCELEGYKLTSCPALKVPQNYCPYDISYFEKCVCKAGLVTCTKPYYGVGESCDGKYASCKLDNGRGCKEDGYTQTGTCNSVQVINKKCPYDPTYFDKCVCRSDLVSCPTPLQGVGTACGGKYKSCKCPSNYKSCDCGKAAGASSCTWNGVTKYSSCKACCTPSRDETGCSCGTHWCSDGCGGSRRCCDSCYSSSSSSSSGGSLCTRICSERGLIEDNIAGSICRQQGLYVVQLGYFGDPHPVCPCSRCGTWAEHNGH